MKLKLSAKFKTAASAAAVRCRQPRVSYPSFKLSYRDLVTMMGERGIEMAHTTILRSVQHYSPEFEKRWKRYARSVGES